MSKLGLATRERLLVALTLALFLGACSGSSPESSDGPESSESDDDVDDDADDDDDGQGPPTAGDGDDDDDAPDASGGPSSGAPRDGGGAGMQPGTRSDAGVSDASARDAATRDSGTMNPGPTDPEPTEPGSVEPPTCPKTSPAQYEPNPSIGGGGAQFTDSPHFRIFGVSGAQAESASKALEAAYDCFVNVLCWRSSGLSINNNSTTGPYYKMNIYAVGSLGGAAGQMFSDARAGLSYLRVVTSYLTDPKVSVHEYGHALTYHEKGWVDQTRTGAWWETVANWVADTYMTSPLCAASRMRFGLQEGRTLIDFNKTISSAHQVIVDGTSGSGNYYQAWPFLTYLTNNPDRYPGMGATGLRDMFRKHMRNNETPLHVLERLAAPIKVQKIVGRYWARMAYLDIGHKQAQASYMTAKSRLSFANLDPAGSGNYRVKAARQPKYMGANIIPLTGTGKITAQVTSMAPFTATLAVRASNGAVRYVDLENGSGEATLASGEEASLVVVNTPAALIMYDPFSITGEVARGLDYQVALTGAMPAN